MRATIVLGLFCCVTPLAAQNNARCGSFVHPPTFCLDDVLVGSAEPYVPQPGDIFLATDPAFWSRAGHFLAGGPGVHHSGIFFRKSDGDVALLIAGPHNSTQVEVLDPVCHMSSHLDEGDKVWVRRRSAPLTAEQSACLTAFAERQAWKRFAVTRLLCQVTIFRTRGPIRTYVVGRPHGDRDEYFCAELVVEACVAAGLMRAEDARPSATYPRELFFGRSINPFLDTHLDLHEWHAPSRWVRNRDPA
jgi:hypothetical protein